jgi:hypothetical protein
MSDAMPINNEPLIAPTDEEILDAIKDGLNGWIGVSDLDEAAESVRATLWVIGVPHD